MIADPWFDALARQDVAGMHRRLHDDVVLRPAASLPVRGRDQVLAWLTLGWASSHSAVHISRVDVEGAISVATVEWRVAVAPSRVRTEHALIVLIRADDVVQTIVIDDVLV